MNAAISRPEVFHFDSYREFLRCHFDFLRICSGESARSIGEKAGFRSPNYLNLIMSGKRNLSEQTCTRLCVALGLSSSEQTFFKNLVRLDQSKKASDRKRHRSNLLKSKRFNNVVPFRSKAAAYYANWYYVVIREMVTLKDFTEDANVIAKKLGGGIKSSEVKKALKDMLELGLLTRNSEGRLQQVDKTVTADDSITNSALKDFHFAMIEKAHSALDTLPSSKRDVSGITIPVNAEMFEKMRLMITSFRRELLRLSSECEDATLVAQVNFQMFDLISATGENENE